MADYAVRINNPFASLIGGQVSIPPAAKKKNKKAKAAAAAGSSDVTVMPGGGVAVGGHTADSEAVIDEFEPVKDSKKKRKEKKAAESKQKEEPAPAPAAESASDKHVRFGEASQNGHTEQKRRSSLKRDQNDKKGDSAIVNQMVALGYTVSDVIAAIEELEQDGQDPYKDTTKLLKRLQEVEVARVTKGSKPAAETVNLLDNSAPAASQPKGKKNAAAKAAAAAAIAAEQAQAAKAPAPAAAPAQSAEDAEWSTASGKKGKKKSKKDGADVPATPAKPAAPAATAASPRPAERKEQKKEEKAVPVEEPVGHQLSATERVETSARNWDPFGEDGLTTLEKWATRLESAERTKQSKGADTEGHVLFWHSFTASKALEELSRNILLGKLTATNNQQASTVSKAENLILRIFDTTLFGSSTHHKWLLSSIRALSKPIVACHAKEELIAKVLALITNQKQGRVAHSQLAELLLESAAASKKQAPKAENKQRDPFSELQENSEDATTALAVRFESVRNIHASLSKVLSAEALTQTFRALEREILVHVDRSRKELASLQQQKESVSHKREGLAMSQKMELERLQQQERQVTSEKLALQDKKRELMLELDRVDSRIKAIEADQARIATGISNIQTHSSSNSQNLVHMEAELNSRINALGKDESAAQIVTKFIEDVRSRVLEASNKDHQQLEQAFRNSSRSYLSQLGDYLNRHHALLVFLKDRISFCTNKLNQAKEEKARMQQLGISGSLSTKNAADLAEMSAMVEQDNTAIQRISTKVLHAIQSAAKHIREFGIHTDSQSGYAAFLSELRTKRSNTPGFSFDISVLPEPSTAPVAQPAAASASTAGNLALNLSASNMYTYSSPPAVAPVAATNKTIAPARPSAIAAFASTLPMIPGMVSGPSISLSDFSSSPAPAPAPAPAPTPAPAAAPASPSADASADGANGRRKPPMVRGTRGGPRVMSASAAPSSSVAISFEETSAPPPPPASGPSAAPSAPSSASGPRRKAPSQAPAPSKKAWAVNNQAAASETGADFPTLGTEAPASEDAIQSPQSGKQRSKRSPPGFSSPTSADATANEAEVTIESEDN